MQLTGRTCTSCLTSILIAADGTYCARCSSPMHVACLERLRLQCPKCRSEALSPTANELRTMVCISCGKTNARRDHCEECNDPLRWNSVNDFVTFHAEITDRSSKEVLRSLLSLVALVAAVAVGGYFTWRMAVGGTFRAFGRPLVLLLALLLPALGWSLLAAFHALRRRRLISESLPAHLRDIVSADA